MLHAKQQKWALLPSDQAHTVARLCSRSSLPKVDGGWQPTMIDVNAMENALSEAAYVRGKLAHSTAPANDPHHYYRQYVGVVIAGRKLIYVNGICGKPPSSWKQAFADICDGGCNWGVLYDPVSGEFSQFGINGIA